MLKAQNIEGTTYHEQSLNFYEPRKREPADKSWSSWEMEDMEGLIEKSIVKKPALDIDVKGKLEARDANGSLPSPDSSMHGPNSTMKQKI